MSSFDFDDRLAQVFEEFEKNHPGGLNEIEEFGKEHQGEPTIEEDFDELFQRALNNHKEAINLILRLDSELRCVCLHVKILEAMLVGRNKEGCADATKV